VSCPVIAGLALAWILLEAGAGDPTGESGTFFFYPFVRHEPIHFSILLVLTATLSVFFVGRVSMPRAFSPRWLVAPAWPVPILVGGVVFAIATLGEQHVLHGYLFTMDEFVVDFQARVFAAGHIQAAIPPQWVPFTDALTPFLITVGSEGDTWTSAYLPVAAAIRALFVLVGAPNLTNPVLATLTIPLVWLVGRRLWPAQSTTAWVPTILLAASPQFLFTSMSAYAMSAHLLLNLAWLYLYLVGTRASLAVAGLVGVLALGLHQPNIHALFAAPLLLRLVLLRRWRAVAYFAAIYTLGASLWVAWWFRFNPSMGGVPGAIFSLPGAAQILIQPVNFGLLVSWQPIAMSLLAIVAVLRWRHMSIPIRDLTLGLILTLVFFFFVNLDQGHGWGYRYAYGVLGNLALLAGQGWTVLNDEWKRRQGPALLIASLLIALVVQAPIRAVQIETFVRPFADSMAFVRSLPADVALVERTDAWYAKDLVRNDPWLTNRPAVMYRHRLDGSQLEALRRGRVVRKVEPAELQRTGMSITESRR
jgi:hypothetical protein